MQLLELDHQAISFRNSQWLSEHKHGCMVFGNLGMDSPCRFRISIDRMGNGPPLLVEIRTTRPEWNHRRCRGTVRKMLDYELTEMKITVIVASWARHR